MYRLFNTYTSSLSNVFKLFFGIIIAFSLSACGGSGSSGSSSNLPTNTGENTGATIDTEGNIAEIAQQAYVFGFPLVEHFKMVYDYLGPDTEIGANIFVHKDRLLTADDREIIGPNNDTLNSSIMFDLRSEPIVISIPTVPDRYFSIQLLNIFTDNLPLIASDQKGADSESIILAGPNWNADAFNNADNLPIIQSDSSIVLGFLRIGVINEADVSIAQSYQSQVLVQTLSEHFGSTSPDPLEAIQWPEAFDVKTDASADFFQYMNFMMQFHAFSENESAILEEISALNIGGDEVFSFANFDTATQSSIEQGINAARTAIRFPSGFGNRNNGWSIPDDRIGNYGVDYAYRAVIAWYGTYAMPLTETAYFLSSIDSNGENLSGENIYELHFPAGSLPSDSHFWSLTLYNSDRFLADNILDRYSMGDRSDFLEFNGDGSLTIYLQHSSPGADLESNWLPTPEDEFSLSFRIYGPDESIQAGNYQLPAVELAQ